MTNVIGDIAGRYKTLMALIDKMPAGEVISVGDMVDRGPRSKEVVEFFMKNGKAIMGNHEHFMLDFYDKLGLDNPYYGVGMWQWNGGDATEKSFDNKRPSEELLNWVAALPLYMEIDGCLISHAFIPSSQTLEEACALGTQCTFETDYTIMWSREEPIRRPEYALQIAGHNSQMGLKRFKDDEGEFAVCLDDSKKKILTGIHLPSREVYQQEYID